MADDPSAAVPVADPAAQPGTIQAVGKLGTYVFPAGTSAAAIDAAIDAHEAQAGSAPASAPPAAAAPTGAAVPVQQTPGYQQVKQQFIDDETKTSGGNRAPAASALQYLNGATFGFAPELEGGLSAARQGLINMVNPDGQPTVAQAYQGTKDATRELANEKINPYAAFALNMAGGSGIGGAAGEAIGAVPTLAGKIAASVGLGAGAGAAYGAGNSPDDRTAGALTGALYGGGAGIVLPVAAIGARGAGNLVGNIADKAGLSGSALGNFLGVATPEQKATGLFAQALQREPGSLSASDILSNLSVNPDKPMVLADSGAVGGPIARLTRGVLDVPGAGGATGAQYLADRDLGTPVNGPYDMFRQGGAADRIIGDAQSAFGQGSAPATIDQLIAKGDADSVPLYDAFRAENPVPAEKIAPFMSSPTFRSALSRATTTALDRGENPMADLIDYNEAGDPISVKGGAFPPQTLDQIKQGIDDTWLAAKATGDRGATSTANNLRSRFLGFMDEQYPNTYPQARAAFAGPAVSRDAIQQGMDVFNTAPEDVASALSSLNPEDQNNFRLGVQQAIVNKVKNTQDGANEVAKIFGNPAKRGALAAAFSSPDALNQFSQNLGIENRMAATKNLTAGSRTTPSTADQAELVGGLADAAAHTAAGSYLGAATRIGGMVLGSLRQGSSEKTNAALARVLFNPDLSANTSVLRNISPAGRYLGGAPAQAAPLASRPSSLVPGALQYLMPQGQTQ